MATPNLFIAAPPIPPTTPSTTTTPPSTPPSPASPPWGVPPPPSPPTPPPNLYLSHLYLGNSRPKSPRPKGRGGVAIGNCLIFLPSLTDDDLLVIPPHFSEPISSIPGCGGCICPIYNLSDSISITSLSDSITGRRTRSTGHRTRIACSFLTRTEESTIFFD